MSFDESKPTVQMLGRFQPWHDGHKALFERCIEKTGQVVIMVRTMPESSKNPFQFSEVKRRIVEGLPGYVFGKHFVILRVPNITNITYGRDVGYTIEKETLDPAIESISATKIRESLKGKLDNGIQG